MNSILSLNIPKQSKEKIVILTAALIVRFVIGFIFFGSIDITNSIRCSLEIFHGDIFINVPYLPIIPIFIWFGGILNVMTPLPLTVCYKIIPIIFDSLLALLIYDIVRKRNPGLAFKAALLYAFSPVAIIIDCLHGQWDSIFLFFVTLCFYIRDFFEDSKKKYFLFGVLFGFSFMVKPMSLMFLPIFIEPWFGIKKGCFKKYFINQASSATGLSVIAIVCFSLFLAFGYDLEELMARVLDYSNNGVQILGLPLVYPLNEHPFFLTRFWIVGVLIFMSGFYYIKKLEAFDIVLFSFAFSVGMSGISPQYLIWVVPILLIMNRYRLAALYSFVVTAFYLVYYINPMVSPDLWENMSTFAALKGFKWLMPPLFLTESSNIPIVNMLGNYFVPLCALLVALRITIKAFTAFWKPGMETEFQNIKRSKLIVFKNNYILFNLAFWSLTILVYVVFRNKNLYDSLNIAYNSKLTWYSLIKHGKFFIGTYGDISFFNIIFILFFVSICWSIYAYSVTIKSYEEIPDKLKVKKEALAKVQDVLQQPEDLME